MATKAEMKAIAELLKYGGGEVRIHEGVFFVRQPDRPRNEVNRVEVVGKQIICQEVAMDDPETAQWIEETWMKARRV